MLWHYRQMGEMSSMDWLRVVYHALPLDLSVAAYVTAAMAVWVCVSIWWKGQGWQRVADGGTLVLITICTMVLVGDNACFDAWGYHWDKSIFVYLASPKTAWACAEWYVWLGGGILCAVLIGLWTIAAHLCHIMGGRGMREERRDESEESVWIRGGKTILLVVVSGLLFLPIRGSVTVSTMNTGRVYFSSNPMLNLAAVNPVFHVMESIDDDFNTAKYTYMTKEESAYWLGQLYEKEGSESESILTTTRPDIVWIIMESFSKNAWEAMPNLQRLSKEGVFFSNAYAASYRQTEVWWPP